MLPGLTSRWMRPRSWAASSAAATWDEQADGAFGVERPLAAQQLPQVGSLDVAHRDEQGAVRLAGLEDRDDVRVVERSASFDSRRNRDRNSVVLG